MRPPARILQIPVPNHAPGRPLNFTNFLRCHGYESHEELVAELLNVFVDFLCEMVQEVVHFFAFGLGDFVSNLGCFGVDFFEILSSQSADLLGLFLGDVSDVSENRCKNPRHVLHFLIRHGLTSVI